MAAPRSTSPSSAAWARSAATARAIEIDGRMVLIDCGLMFPDADMLGVDLVLPDFTYLRDNADRIDGVIATHGHEDHTGGLSFLLPRRAQLPASSARSSPSASPATASRRPACSAAPSSSPSTDGERRRDSDRSIASSSPSPTRCPTASPPPSTRPRARSCTRATSSWT
ncbi:MAG: MBL fold metallo-hydrolase [Acidimicrobiia bacterium]|nr:MBL fold metallo-hydrolase [Acidimicrobiia bacterium]